MTRLATLRNAAFAAVAVLALHPTSAHAQAARYCAGKLVADTFYSTVSSDGKTALVDYFAMVRNHTKDSIVFVPSMAFAQQNGSTIKSRLPLTPITMAAYSSNKLKLLTLAVNNPSGQGAPVAKDVGVGLIVVCR